ncbi:MAG: DUF2232 domain-containing protein [Geminicoccaceae bacterium]
MSQALAFAVLAGILSGGLIMLPLIGPLAFFLAYLAPLPLLLVGLTMGGPAAMIAAVAAGLVVALIIGLLPALVISVTLAAPSWFIVRQALLSRQDNGSIVWFPAGLLLSQLTALALFGVALAFILFLGQEGGLVGALETGLVDMIKMVGEAADHPSIDPAAVQPLMIVLEAWKDQASIIPAQAAASWLVMMVLNTVIAQAIAVRVGWNRRPSPVFSELELPLWLWPLMAAALFLTLIGGTGLSALGSSALIVLVTPFAFLGLAVIHKLADRWPRRRMGLVTVYVAIVVFNFAFQWPILPIIVAVGLVENWAHLRRYL